MHKHIYLNLCSARTAAQPLLVHSEGLNPQHRSTGASRGYVICRYLRERTLSIVPPSYNAMPEHLPSGYIHMVWYEDVHTICTILRSFGKEWVGDLGHEQCAVAAVFYAVCMLRSRLEVSVSCHSRPLAQTYFYILHVCQQAAGLSSVPPYVRTTHTPKECSDFASHRENTRSKSTTATVSVVPHPALQ